MRPSSRNCAGMFLAVMFGVGLLLIFAPRSYLVALPSGVTYLEVAAPAATATYIVTTAQPRVLSPIPPQPIPSQQSDQTLINTLASLAEQLENQRKLLKSWSDELMLTTQLAPSRRQWMDTQLNMQQALQANLISSGNLMLRQHTALSVAEDGAAQRFNQASSSAQAAYQQAVAWFTARSTPPPVVYVPGPPQVVEVPVPYPYVVEVPVQSFGVPYIGPYYGPYPGPGRRYY